MLKVWHVRIADDGSGRTCFECDARLPIVDRIAIAEAGMSAAEVLNVSEPLPQAGFSDAVKIGNLLDGHSDEQRERLICEGRKRATEILDTSKAVLIALSNALARSGFLDETALARLVCA
jgi:propanediol dehydratase large subunit